MTTTSKATWPEQTAAELEELLGRAGGDVPGPGVAYRILVLLARASQMRAVDPSFEAGPRGRAALADPASWATLRAACELPEPAALLERLERALADMDDPVGRLTHEVLAVDDRLSVGMLLDETDGLAAFARHAAARLALHPERTLTIGARADARLATLPAAAPAGMPWRAIADAAAEILAGQVAVEAAPSSPRVRSRVMARLLSPRGKVLALRRTQGAPVIEVPFAQDAAATDSTSLALDVVDEEREVGRLYVDRVTRRLQLELRVDGEWSCARLQAVDPEAGSILAEEDLRCERDGRDFYIDLGTVVGPESVRHRLLARIGPASARAILQIILRSKHD